jgi:DNA-binding beta-propeller fold protein YncE
MISHRFGSRSRTSVLYEAAREGSGSDLERRSTRRAWSTTGRRAALALSLGVIGLLLGAQNTLAVTGELTQASREGCISQAGGYGCTNGKALYNPYSVAVSPDGENAYVAAYGSNAVAALHRDETTGDLFQSTTTAGCVSEDGSGGDCADGKQLSTPISAAISPDGKNVYVASYIGGGVAIFQRDTTTGQLTQLSGNTGCVSEDGTDPYDSGATCTDGKALAYPKSVAVSADGKSVYVASFYSHAVAAFQRDATTGALTQLAGTAGCVSEDGTDPYDSGATCADGVALENSSSVAASDDGKSVYVASYGSSAVAIFQRDSTTGALTQPAGGAGCVSQTGTDPYDFGATCADGKALGNLYSVVPTPDGKSVYTTSYYANAVAAFQRDTTTGALTQLAGSAGCVSEDGTDPNEVGATCADGKALVNPFSSVASPDGKSVYVASYGSGGVATFQRDTTTGALTQLSGISGCVTDDGSSGQCTDGKAVAGTVAVGGSPDGANIYASSNSSSAVAIFQRDGTTGALTQQVEVGCISELGLDGHCVDGKGLSDPRSIAVSPDGKSAYAASYGSSSVAVFARDAATGTLTQLAGTAGCVSEDGTDPYDGSTCADGKGLSGPGSVAVSPDGKNVYVATYDSGGVAIFQRDTTTGQLTQLAGTGGCVTGTGAGGDCADGKALNAPYSVAVSPDGKSVYVASIGSSAVAIFQRDTTTGQLTQLAGNAGCMSEDGTDPYDPGATCTDGKALASPYSLAVSPDGKTVYVASYGSSAVAILQRDTTTGQLTQLAGSGGCVGEYGYDVSDGSATCSDGKALYGAISVAVSADGKNVYSTSVYGNAVAAFQRDTTTGALTQLAGTAGCVSEDGTDPYDSGTTCTDGKALGNPWGVTVSPDNGSVYVASNYSYAIASLARDATTGELTQLPGDAGCISEYGYDLQESGSTCADGKAFSSPYSVAVSSDNKNVYAATYQSVPILRREAATIGPSSPALTDTDPDSPANNNSPKVKGVADPGSAVSLYTTADCSGAAVATGTAAAFASPGLTVTVADDSTTTFHATATDAGANTSACSTSSITYAEDSTPPATPSVTATAPASPANNNSPKVVGSAAAGSTVRIYTSSDCSGSPVVTGTAADFASPGLAVSVPDNSTRTFRATATDAAGNASGCSTTSVTYVEDSTPPATPSVTATAPASPANNNSPKVVGSAAAGSTVRLYTTADCSGTPVATGTATTFASPGITVNVANDSTTTFRATAADAAGNASGCSTTSVTYVEDSTPPAAPSLTATTPASPANNNSPKIQGSAEAGSTVRLYKTADCSGTAAATGSAATFASPGLGVSVSDNSTTTFHATTRDAAGNTSPCSTSSITYVEDSTAPAAPTVSATDPVSPSNDNFPEVKGSAEAGSTVNIYTSTDCSGAPAATGSAATFASPGLTVSVADNSTTTFRATATDAAGNLSPCSTTSVTYVHDSTPTGRLTQPSGIGGCVSETGSAGACIDGRGLDQAFSVAISPDGKSVYAVSRNSDAIVRFDRNTLNGVITQPAGTAGCISNTGTGGQCTHGRVLDGAYSVTVSPDGKNVYVTATASDSVAILKRDTATGALTQPTGPAGCITDTGNNGNCVNGRALDSPVSVAVSQDGTSVYVATLGSDAVVRLTRDTTTGALTQPPGTAGCISNTGSGGACVDGRALDGATAVAVSADGSSVYVASKVSDSLVRLNRDTTTGGISQPAGVLGCVTETGSGGACTDGKALNGAKSVALSPDGKSVYVASYVSNAIAAFARNTTNGVLTQLANTAGCVSENGTSGACADGRVLNGAWAVTVSADGKNAYAASLNSDAVATFARSTSGQLSQLADDEGCVSQGGTAGCATGKALDGPVFVAVSADGKSVYSASQYSDAVARFIRGL